MENKDNDYFDMRVNSFCKLERKRFTKIVKPHVAFYRDARAALLQPALQWRCIRIAVTLHERRGNLA